MSRFSNLTSHDLRRPSKSVGRAHHTDLAMEGLQLQAALRSSPSITAERSSAYPSMLFAVDGWLDLPCPRRSTATQRYPRWARNSIRPAQASEFRRLAVRERYDRALAPVFAIDLRTVFCCDRAHDFLLFRCDHRLKPIETLPGAPLQITGFIQIFRFNTIATLCCVMCGALCRGPHGCNR